MKKCQNRIDLFERIPRGSVGAELGVFEGLFAEQIFERISPRKMYAVDLFRDQVTSGDQHGQNRHLCDMKARHAELRKKWSDSALEAVQAESAAWLWSQEKGSLDWVYIDTNHDYQHTSHELAAAHHAVKAGGWIMGHDWDMEFSGVISATSEYVNRWKSDLELTTNDGLASFAMMRPPPPRPGQITGTVLQVAHGSHDEKLWSISGPSIKDWAEQHGWHYQVQRENPASPMSGHWAKLCTELDILASDSDSPLLTLDADVLLRTPHISPAEAFECPGLGMAIGGQASGFPHFNCGVRAAWGAHARMVLELAWRRRDQFSAHAWNEQAAIHASMGMFPGTVHPISPKWNHNYNDRHLQGEFDAVISGYHGTSNREGLMRAEFNCSPRS